MLPGDLARRLTRTELAELIAWEEIKRERDQQSGDLDDLE